MSTIDFPAILDSILDSNDLEEDEARYLMDEILTGELGPERLAAFVTAVRAKGVWEDELVGFARSMLQHAQTIQAPGGKPILDTCGTGGAPHKTVNVSTTAAFLVAAQGATVAKHGNRSVTRPSGSADVLEEAGARLDLEPEQVEAVLKEAGIAFLFAPTFHPAMRHAAPVRQKLGIKTVFNLLGPLTNPARATHQVLGVYDPQKMEPMARALARLGCRGGYVLHGEPGFDEATPAGDVLFIRIEEGKVGLVERLDPTSLGIPPCTPQELLPVPREDAASFMRSVLAGEEGGPRVDAIVLNAAFALTACGITLDLQEGVETARQGLADGIGTAKLDRFIEATRKQ